MMKRVVAEIAVLVEECVLLVAILLIRLAANHPPNSYRRQRFR
jgi:hypothetical protein